MDLFRTQRGMLNQAFAQVREVSVRVSVGSHTLVDLTDMHISPRDIFHCQHPQHNPWCVTATDSQDKAATGSYRRTSIAGDCSRSRPCDGISIIKHLKIHRLSPNGISLTTGRVGCGDLPKPSYTRPALSAGLGDNAEI